MDFFKKYKTIIIIALVVIIGFVLYAMFFSDGEEEQSLTSERNPDAVLDEDIESDILPLLLTLQDLTLDGAIFDLPVFQRLTDFSQELAPQPVGRPNPFAPIGGGFFSDDEVTASFAEDDDGGDAE